MNYCGTETLQLAGQFKMADRWIKLQETQLLLDVARQCSGLVVPIVEIYLLKIS